VVKTVSFFLMGNHLGLAPMVPIVKKTGVETTFPLLRESGVKVRIAFIPILITEEQIR
jgi:hypothetical protein